jgi:hypothetical protein
VGAATGDEEKIYALSNLADYYSLFKLNAGSDSVLQKAFFLAEQPNDREQSQTNVDG